MLEVGWSELLVIAIILIVVVGPKDLPAMMRTFGRVMGRVRTMANDFRSQFDEAMREAELDDVRKGLSEVNKYNPATSIRDAVNPIRQFGQDLKADLQKASTITSKPAVDEGTPAAELASDPVVGPEPVKSEPEPAIAVSKPTVASATTPAASAPIAEAKPAKPAKARKAAVQPADDYPPPAKKTVKRKAAEPPVEHQVQVVASDKKTASKPATRKKTAKTGDA
jgi:sec-independent protein translocase protein TatB